MGCYRYWTNNLACTQCSEYTWASHLTSSSRGRGKKGKALDQRGLWALKHNSSSLTLSIRTFKATSEKEKILQKLEDIATELEDDMENGGWAGRTVTLKYKLDTYEVFTRAKSLNRWIRTKSELYETGKELLQPEWPLCLRLIGLRVTKLKDRRKKDGGILKVWGYFL